MGAVACEWMHRDSRGQTNLGLVLREERQAARAYAERHTRQAGCLIGLNCLGNIS